MVQFFIVIWKVLFLIRRWLALENRFSKNASLRFYMVLFENLNSFHSPFRDSMLFPPNCKKTNAVKPLKLFCLTTFNLFPFRYNHLRDFNVRNTFSGREDNLLDPSLNLVSFESWENARWCTDTILHLSRYNILSFGKFIKFILF